MNQGKHISRQFCRALLFTAFLSASPLAVSKNLPEWEIKDCKVSLTTNHVTISTDGFESGGTLRFKIQPSFDLKTPPNLTFTKDHRFTPFVQEGAHRLYSFELPYETAYEMSRLLYKDSAFIISYAPNSSIYEMKAHVPTSSLPIKVQQLQKQCHHLASAY